MKKYTKFTSNEKIHKIYFKLKNTQNLLQIKKYTKFTSN